MRKIQGWMCVLALAGVMGCADSESDSARAPQPAVTERTSGDADSAPSTGSPVTTAPMAPSGGLDFSAARPAPAMSGSGTAAGPAASSSGTTPAPGALPPSSAPAMAPPAATPPPSSGAAGSAASGAAGSAAVAPQPPVQSGTLTAGTWDDNRNFDRFVAYREKLEQSGRLGILPLSDEEYEDSHEAFKDVHDGRKKLDVSLVIDTTGSMSDEIRYLQSEFLSLSRAIEADYPDSEQRWSLVVYRDVGDVYVTRTFDFRDDVNEFRDRLSEQFADGGGDFPEAPDAALEAMNEFSWRADDDVARLAFWVADAPHHEANAEAMAEALRASRGLDVHIYPVASSGIDEFTELTMRSAGQFTGGRYLFLTNDSGVGGDHKEPSIPCYFVTRLDQAILRMVRIELTGKYSEPAADQVVRRGGNPQSGSCKLESGDIVEVF